MFTFSLADALKKGPVVLYFYPAAFTSGCTIEAHDFAEATDSYRALGRVGDRRVARRHRDAAEVFGERMPQQVRGRLRSRPADHEGLRCGPGVAVPEYADRVSYVIAPEGRVDVRLQVAQSREARRVHARRAPQVVGPARRSSAVALISTLELPHAAMERRAEFAPHGNPAPDRKVRKTDDEWRKQLGAEAFTVTRHAGTERPFSVRDVLDVQARDLFSCVCCDTLLFDWAGKIRVGDRLARRSRSRRKRKRHRLQDGPDPRHDARRGALQCVRCAPGPRVSRRTAPSGLRYCMNAAALKSRSIEDNAPSREPRRLPSGDRLPDLPWGCRIFARQRRITLRIHRARFVVSPACDPRSNATDHRRNHMKANQVRHLSSPPSRRCSRSAPATRRKTAPRLPTPRPQGPAAATVNGTAISQSTVDGIVAPGRGAGPSGYAGDAEGDRRPAGAADGRRGRGGEERARQEPRCRGPDRMR